MSERPAPLIRAHQDTAQLGVAEAALQVRLRMDPALYEQIASSAEGTELEALIKLHPGQEPPPGVRVVARFGDIATVRVLREEICTVHDHAGVRSLKAPRLVGCEPAPVAPDEAAASAERSDPSLVRRALEQLDPGGLDTDHPWLIRQAHGQGAGAVVGTLDWGLDFAHPNLRNPDGSTRLLALWDQGATMDPAQPNPYGYGKIHDRAAIDAALQTDDPYAALGYHPGDADPSGKGAHGTHVVDIAAGNGQVEGSHPGLAAKAELVFVHLETGGLHGLATLGDSVRLAEGLDFLAHTAGERPWVCNLSVGKMGGPHDGSTLFEQAMDTLLEAAPGRAIVQSCGNYYAQRAHATGRVRPLRTHTLRWRVHPADVTPNELEVWYPGSDRFTIELQAPGKGPRFRAHLGEHVPVVIDDVEVGRLYHRANDPNNGAHHVDIFLFTEAPAGVWRVLLYGEDVVDGRFDAWIERDTYHPGSQSRFVSRDVSTGATLGTICTGRRTIAVGAFDPRGAGWPLAPFSSAGPTRDGRVKPDVLAPGVAIRAARSMPREPEEAERPGELLTEKSGTSMAAPHVTGAVAVLLAEAARPPPIAIVRGLLLGTAESAAHLSSTRTGQGYLHAERALAAIRAWSAQLGGDGGARPYLPASGRDFVPVAADLADLADLPDTPGLPAVMRATFLPRAMADDDAGTGASTAVDQAVDQAIGQALEAAGLSAAQRRRIDRAGLRAIARAFGPEAFTELVARLRWSAEDIASRGEGTGMLVPRLLLHVPGHFRELARRAPKAREAHALESLGWLRMAALRDQVAQATGRRWWLPRPPSFVTALPAPAPALSPAVIRLATRHGHVDPAVDRATYDARMRQWLAGLAGRQWHQEVAGDRPGLPFYPALVAIPAPVDTARPAGQPGPLPGSPVALQGLTLAPELPLDSDGQAMTELPVLDVLHPVYTALFHTLHELGWNDLVYQMAPAPGAAPGATTDINAQENHAQSTAPDSATLGCMDPRVVMLLEAFHFRWGARLPLSAPMRFAYRGQPSAPAPDPDSPPPRAA